VNAHDANSGIASVKLISVTSNEPDNGLGDGDTSKDIQAVEFGTADPSIQLRAERSGKGTVHVYTNTYVATDLAGNSVTASTTVTFPQSAKK
jgi:endo-1,4-beta-xylanase